MVSKDKQILNFPFGCLTDRLTEISLGTGEDNKSHYLTALCHKIKLFHQ